MTDNRDHVRSGLAKSCFICERLHGVREAASSPSAISRRDVMTGMTAAVGAEETAQPQGYPRPVAIVDALGRVDKLPVWPSLTLTAPTVPRSRAMLWYRPRRRHRWAWPWVVF